MGYRILKALQNLYVKLGGTASDVADVTQTPDMINAIAGLDIGGGGSSLPAVTADDNGSVLTVVEGAWDKAEASGGSDFVVTYTAGENDTYTADKTVTEILAAIEAGKNVKAITGTENGDFLCLNLAKYDTVNNTKSVIFSVVLAIGENIVFVQIAHITSGGTETITGTMYGLEKQSQ